MCFGEFCFGLNDLFWYGVIFVSIEVVCVVYELVGCLYFLSVLMFFECGYELIV